MHRHNRKILSRSAILPLLLAPLAHAAPIITPTFSSYYTLTQIAPPFGAPTYNVGGLAFLAGNPNVLLIGGGAETSTGAIRTVGVTRDPITGHITGFTGPIGTLSTAPDIDGGIAYGPGGDLFYTAWSDNTVGEVKPGSSSPDKIASLPGVSSSTGGLAFIPAGFNGAGMAAITSYNGGTVCTSALSATGSGTYDFGTCGNTVNLGGNPEGIQYVAAGAPGFLQNSVLVNFYANFTGTIDAFTLDANGLPLLSSEQAFITGIDTAEGLTMDPLTGDFLVTSFHPNTNVYVIQNNASRYQAQAPEPAAWPVLLAAGGLLLRRLRRASV